MPDSISVLMSVSLSTFHGDLDCLNVNRSVAVVSATGKISGPNPSGPLTVSARTVDSPTAGQSTLGYRGGDDPDGR